MVEQPPSLKKLTNTWTQPHNTPREVLTGQEGHESKEQVAKFTVIRTMSIFSGPKGTNHYQITGQVCASVISLDLYQSWCSIWNEFKQFCLTDALQIPLPGLYVNLWVLLPQEGSCHLKQGCKVSICWCNKGREVLLLFSKPEWTTLARQCHKKLLFFSASTRAAGREMKWIKCMITIIMIIIIMMMIPALSGC